jgi:iron(III) transport system substrate-binding protein
MRTIKQVALLIALGLFIFSCTKKSEQKTVWIYTSLYKDTVADIKPILEKKFPDVQIQFYQAGSEEVAAKVQAESMTGKIQADILISSDRFWYEDLANQNKLVAFKPAGSEKIDALFKHEKDFYTTVSYPVMVIAYNTDVIKTEQAPQSFKELTDAKWKDKVSMGSPLASGTSFTSVSFLVEKYGWDYFKSLRKNNIIAEGGNSGVIRRLQSKERPVGIVLLENVLRLSQSDPRIKYVLPKDGAIVQTNVLAIVSKEKSAPEILKIADWFFSEDGQANMKKSFMYPSVSQATIEGGPAFSDILKNAKPWTKDFIEKTMKTRDQSKDEFSKIVF